MSNTHTQARGIFTLTKGKIIIAVSLIFTWWVAHLVPHYEPLIRTHISSRLHEARQKIPSIKVDWSIPPEPESMFNASKVALIIEPRPLPHLVPLMLHMATVVPPDWRFVVIGSNRSVFSIGRAHAIKHQQVIGKLDLMVLPEPWDISSKEMVYRMLTDIRFYDEFLPGVEWILKYESDSILCGNSPTSLNEWLGWSWAGAPRSADDRFSGNGGLSLRKVSAIRRILRFQVRYNNTEAEDEWFGRRLWVLPGEKVTSGLNALAVENVYIEKPMGFHIPDGGKNLPDGVWKNAEQRKKIFDYCPELSLITDMKLERERCKGDDHEGNILPTEEELAEQKRVSLASVASVSKASAASVARVASIASAASAARVASVVSVSSVASAASVEAAKAAKSALVPAASATLAAQAAPTVAQDIDVVETVAPEPLDAVI
ncbi:hypothetical protein SEPCBS119000_000868 [Sporothrix epigloea]|uniref:DUF5672 domain-containing protein n=1 Tax=Sporothrix epigloea TaxID=1892477 RepID=A0ABP0D7L7_9PEZI